MLSQTAGPGRASSWELARQVQLPILYYFVGPLPESDFACQTPPGVLDSDRRSGWGASCPPPSHGELARPVQLPILSFLVGPESDFACHPQPRGLALLGPDRRSGWGAPRPQASSGAQTDGQGGVLIVLRLAQGRSPLACQVQLQTSGLSTRGWTMTAYSSPGCWAQMELEGPGWVVRTLASLVPPRFASSSQGWVSLMH